jgi:hypothetical protein
MLKNVEELVRQERLHKIAKDHQSIGAILDNRVLYDLDEPKKYEKITVGRLLLRSIGQNEVNQADSAIAVLKEEGSNNKITTGNYDVELQIWKSKSCQLQYTQNRRYYFPELEVYKDSMSGLKKKLFKEQINEAIVKIADKYREECKTLKSDMDLNGIFHPEANAHRAHCIYLMKLYKGFVISYNLILSLLINS